MRFDLVAIRPRAEPARTIVPGSTMPRSVGVSPPPQTAPADRQAAANPRARSAAAVPRANHAESPTAACMATDTGNAPHVTRSLTIVATVSTPTLA